MTTKNNIIKPSVVKAIAKQNGRRVSKEFIDLLNQYVIRKVVECSETHNGKKKTLDAAVAGYNGIK
jgi:hypothetical protein